MHQSDTRSPTAPNRFLPIPCDVSLAAPRAGPSAIVHPGRQRSERAPGHLRDRRPEGLLPWQVSRVRAYIDAGLQGRVSLSVAAGHARLSSGYFSRCFRRFFGVTFSRYVARRRVERAQGLMLEDGRKLCQIALACGFADQAHFTRTFGSLTGCSPARWRRLTLSDRPAARTSMDACAG